MKKITFALAVVAAAALAGCGRHDNGGTASTASSQSTTAQAIPTPGSGDSSNVASSTPAPATTAPPADSSTTASTAPAAPDSSMGAGSQSSATTASAGNTAAMGAGPDLGKTTFEKTCQVCHAAGVAGAPKVGDKADWGPRIAQGKDTLYAHALQGFTGKKGMMPPKGGNTALADADVKAAVDYMVAQAK